MYKNVAIVNAFDHLVNIRDKLDFVEKKLGNKHDMRINAAYLYEHGFKDVIDQLFIDIQGKTLEERNRICMAWLELMKMKIISYIVKNKSYKHESDINIFASKYYR